MCFGVIPRTDTKKKFVLKEIELHAQNMIPILDLMVNMIGKFKMTIHWAWEPSLWEWVRYSYKL